MKTDEEILAEIKERSKKQGSMENFMYTLLENAHPAFKESFDSQVIMMFRAAEGLANEIEKANNDPAQKEKILKMLDQIGDIKMSNIEPDDSGNNEDKE